MANRSKFILGFVVILIASLLGFSLLLFYPVSNNWHEPPVQSISITAVGDTIGYNIQNENLAHLAGLVNGTDIFIFNLEGVLIPSNENLTTCKKLPNQSLLTSNPNFVEYLKLAPVTIANMANNHVLECGPEGIKETRRSLLERNIFPLGAGQNLDQACEPLFIEAKGWRVAFVSYNFVIRDAVSANTSKAGAAVLESCKHDYSRIRSQEGADLIIVSIHEGTSWSPQVNREQIELVNKLFDSGADIVVGSAPHMPQAIIVKDGKLAFFSLGNFIFRPDYQMPQLAQTTIVPRIDAYTDRIDVTIYPVRIDNKGIPHIEDRGDIIFWIAENSKEFNTSVDVRDNLGHISIPRRK